MEKGGAVTGALGRKGKARVVTIPVVKVAVHILAGWLVGDSADAEQRSRAGKEGEG